MFDFDSEENVPIHMNFCLQEGNNGGKGHLNVVQFIILSGHLNVVQVIIISGLYLGLRKALSAPSTKFKSPPASFQSQIMMFSKVNYSARNISSVIWLFAQNLDKKIRCYFQKLSKHIN